VEIYYLTTVCIWFDVLMLLARFWAFKISLCNLNRRTFIMSEIKEIKIFQVPTAYRKENIRFVKYGEANTQQIAQSNWLNFLKEIRR